MTIPGKEFLFVALGGSAEIGMNANLYGCEGKWIMLDLGVTFGTAEYPGIDLIMPDLEFIEERVDDLLGIVLTHGHEDHIGALPYLAEDLGVPLYASPFTAGLITRKLEEVGLAGKVKLHIVDVDARLTLGPFSVRLVPLAHSIPEMSAALIETRYGRVFHTGDWKLDDDAVIGESSSAAMLSAIGDSGIDALLCDSTNAFNANVSGSESSVREGLMQAVANAKGRAIITSFASNVARLHTLGEVCKATERTLCIAGRSLERMLAIARSVDLLADFPETIDFEAAMRLPRSKLMVIATGGQGEPRAALARMVNMSHQIKLEAGDTVIFSSRQIPGNDVAIGRIMNQLAAMSIATVTEKQAHIHVSGHPGQPELAALYGWLRPDLLIPVHGEMRHMREQARFALECGVPKSLVQSNGDVIRLAPAPAKRIDQVRTGRLILDGNLIMSADGKTINERRKISREGHIIVALTFSRGNIRDIDICYRGVPVEDEDDGFLHELRTAAMAAGSRSSRSSGSGGGNRNRYRESIRGAVRSAATRWTGKKPVVDVMMLGNSVVK